MKKVLMIDPWGLGGESLYLNGLCGGLSKNTDLTLITNCYYENEIKQKFHIKCIFFKYSQNMQKGNIRKVVRGLEYILAYKRIIKELKSEAYDIVHFQWLLLYPIDKIFLKKIKRHCKKLVLTAHDIIPHIDGEKYVQDLNEIYGIFDSIILHGESLKKEFDIFFPNLQEKIILQRHGTYLNQSTEYNVSLINNNLVDMVEKYKNNKIFVFVGRLFYNKGVDRIAKLWMENFKDSSDLLIIAGGKISKYKELEVLEENIKKCSNIIYIDREIEDNMFNYLVYNSDIIILPYRHASMSGVVFTASEFCKPVLCTNVGSLAEYVINNENSFVIEDNDEKLLEKMLDISQYVSKNELISMGIELNKYISSEYSWDVIANRLAKECYEIS